MMSGTCISCGFYSPCSVLGKLCDILNSDYHYYVEDEIANDWNNGHWDDSGE